MVRSKILSSDKIRTHAQRSVLTKAIGISLFIQPDVTEHRLQEGDHLILCSDGVWSVIQDDDFASVVSDADSMEAISQRLIDMAIQNETDDNASVVVFHVNRFVPSATEHGIKNGKGNGWFENLRKLVS